MGRITRFFVTWGIIVLLAVFLYNHYYKTGQLQPEKPSHQASRQTGHEQAKGKGIKTGMPSLIGMSSQQIKTKFGQPDRISPSAYGYDWWVYDKNSADYMQIGVENGKVVTVFAFGQNLNTGSLKINGKRKDVLKGIKIEQKVPLNVDGNAYDFELSTDDIKARPLVQVGNEWAILYFDTFTDRLAGIRYLDARTLAALRPYSLTYRGTLIQEKNLNRNQWETVEAGEDKGILAMTNVIRSRFGLPTLKWNEKAAKAAFGHSKDMAVNHYFDHTSPKGVTVGERLHAAGINYMEAGENIAYNYPDAIAAMFGWLNSKGHRENLLHKAYTSLGVGVYEKEYTQDFVKPF